MEMLDLIQLARTYISYDELEKAKSTLTQHLRTTPNCQHAHDLLLSISRGREQDIGVISCPHVIIPDFLPADLINEFLGAAHIHLCKFEKGRVSGYSEIAPEVRNSLRLKDLELDKKMEAYFSPRLHRELSRYCSQLAVALFEISEIELKFCCYPNGAYFHTHRDDQAAYSDDPDKRIPCGRRISFAYYFHRHPQSFTGGELRLYATDRRHNIFSRNRMDDISPRFNTLVLFPSGFFHEVLKVSEPSGDIMNGRFAINGHICEALSPQEITTGATQGVAS
ncbi:2OG-Fe(II) oxygenase [Hahella sp. HN01]|uniref:2OG-Fe(II) oxygenase n=1 Tax=unclassified Hahella TaxID=2624107 RepID=UPI001C1EB5A2|nr:2OG-Fe(II) oxygenase [Hahella sp. HN01]MBU6952773.1 2OG-Fe(II) oxygenase [Hahella sp. HN01]